MYNLASTLLLHAGGRMQRGCKSESETNKWVLGVEHPTTLKSVDNLATTLKFGRQGRWKEAELQFLALEKIKQFLGVEHPYMFASMGNLAITYQDQNGAEEL
jgi:hypothetical protein